ncbi:hypothetical protein EV644_113129 [Kribbella orskensis]|uniref:SWIM-type domain-containing protein n=1 Tax=Kribbella orskensis TaxID=2512216 RepID=A0ABY2BH27_9ACTN|nr:MULTISPECIES: hypothetical protein [Kribbella]TCN36660.1 hypothetical protein EV642_114128 [Kribbella sp. VKM Ac-2500]TCO17899.1 hypothetical protein EV644_113129 [Kribbella orskensis]
MSGEEARGFPAFPASAGRRSTRGKSWWGRAWVQALEDTSLDSDQLRKGRRTANSGQVGTITISPGRIAATVYSPDDTHDAVVLVDQLSDDDWRLFLDQVAARAGHIAALLDGEMPHDLVEAAADAGVPLLPGIGDLDPSCTCDSWELPCQHAAGLSYQTGWLLDEDPFVLLLIRGRSRDALLEDLQHRAGAGGASASVGGMASTASGSGSRCRGVLAAAVFEQVPGALPEVRVVPGKVALDDLVVSGTEPVPGLQSALLPLLVLDAARRARAQLSALLSGAPDPWVLEEWQDAVRLAADYPVLADRLASATGKTVDLARGVQAWSYGGAPGLDVLEHTWDPDPGDLARARTELLAAADEELEITTEHNRLTTSGAVVCQVRLDRIGRWHPYRLVDNTWTPAAPADRDPTAALAVSEPLAEDVSENARDN